MDGRFVNNPLLSEQEDSENSPENSGDSPRSSMFHDSKMTSTSSPKRSRRAIQKRVVSVPIKDVEGSRLKGEMSIPPSDSWAWRKYGQKPIKGSPYPRGYYRCSSSKGCPARKQVERSRLDPSVLLVTYSCEHNHPWPASKNNQQNHRMSLTTTMTTTTTILSSAATTIATSGTVTVNPAISNGEEEKPTSATFASDSDDKFDNLGEASLISTNEFGWFSDFESTSTITMLEGPILTEANVTHDTDMYSTTSMIFSMGEEDESLFADLGELPECSTVFGRGMIERDEERRRQAPWCGTTG